MAQRNQKLFKRLAQVWLETNILLQNLVNHVRLVELELSQVCEVNLHRGLLVLLDLFRLVYVEPHGLSGFGIAVSVILVVRVVFAQFKPIRSNHGSLTCGGSYRTQRQCAGPFRPCTCRKLCCGGLEALPLKLDCFAE